MKAEQFTPALAAKILEDLRKGIPPSGQLEYFTVGRKEEISFLDEHLADENSYSLLLKANYGSGKSHLLQLIREKAMGEDYAVSLVALDAKSGVRFNRMDQIFGAIMRNLTMPLEGGGHGDLAYCLDFLAGKAKEAEDEELGSPGYDFWSIVSNNWKWDFSEELGSDPMFVAMRAWVATDKAKVRDMILDWLRYPEVYNSRKKELFEILVAGMRTHFRDPRSDWQFYDQKSLTFLNGSYLHCWNALDDLNRMFVACGMSGLCVLVDEFEDVLTNLTHINHKETAFWNLFRFVSGKRFSGKAFFAVTPSFVEKCKEQLKVKGRLEIDFAQFDKLPTFEMSPLVVDDLLELAKRIVRVHLRAYAYKEVSQSTLAALKNAVVKAASSAVQDRARLAIRNCVSVLDDALE